MGDPGGLYDINQAQKHNYSIYPPSYVELKQVDLQRILITIA